MHLKCKQTQVQDRSFTNNQSDAMLVSVCDVFFCTKSIL
jgi:hypothetical protein